MSAPHQNRETESQPGPPLVHFYVSMEKAHNSMASLGRVSMGAQMNKGMQTQACMNGAQIHYSFLALIIYSPLMHPRGSIYIPSIRSESSIRSVSRHMEGQ